MIDPAMKKILVVSNNYPYENNEYANVFVHVRVRDYIKKINVMVVVINKYLPEEFVYEGVKVKSFRDKKSLVNFIEGYKPDILIFHLMKFWMVDSIILKLRIPTIIWVHGDDIIRWYRRFFNFSFSLNFIKYIIRTEIQSLYWNKIINFSNANDFIHFVFVSSWIKSIAETDSKTKINNFSIIPNPIDTNLFLYSQKPAELRKKILLLRPFSSKKYANDIAMKGLQNLTTQPCFHDMQFGIYGMGKYFDTLTKPLEQYSNIQINNMFIEHNKIPSIHKKYGVFLCPTRQDAQGVSMCEAMSSGLVPITSNNTGIPEFVSDNVTGLFADTPEEISKAILDLYNDQELFQTMSRRCSDSIREKCGSDKIISKELDLINKFLSR